MSGRECVRLALVKIDSEVELFDFSSISLRTLRFSFRLFFISIMFDNVARMLKLNLCCRVLEIRNHSLLLLFSFALQCI